MTLRRERGRGAALALGLTVALAGCGGDGGSAAGPADAYAVMLEWLAENDVATPGEGCGDDVVFVESIGADGIALDVQVELIDHFEGELDIRFVDSREEAVDDSAPEAPVRDECVLVGLGPIPDGTLIEVRGEVYEERDSVTGYRFDLVRGGRIWLLVDEPTMVEPEGLVDEL